LSSRLLHNIICDEEGVRHEAYREGLQLTQDKALPILRRGLRHWDRKLRNKCAQSIVEILGGKAASTVFPMYANGLLFASASAEKLLQHEDDTLIKYLLRIKGKKDDLARAASLLFERTRYFEQKQAAKEELNNKRKALRDPKKKLKSASALIPEPEITTDKPRPDIVPFLSQLSNKKHASFLYYEWAKENSLDSLYEVFKIPKRSGGERQIENPHPVLKMAQRMLLQELSETARPHEGCHGFRNGRSIITNATPHVGKQVVINLDVRNFFPTISSKRVYGIFRSFGYQGQELRFLTDMTTFGGRLPQGAPTSPILANIACIRLDKRLLGLAGKIGADYTRYADDITFSGPETITSYIRVFKKIIEEEGFQVALPKLRIQRKGARQEVTGLTVNDQVSVPRVIRRRLRAAVHRVHNAKNPFWKGEQLSIQSLKGHLNYLASVHPGSAKDMLKSLT
jgi:retron-type reverse transcriptase